MQAVNLFAPQIALKNKERKAIAEQIKAFGENNIAKLPNNASGHPKEQPKEKLNRKQARAKCVKAMNAQTEYQKEKGAA